MSFKKYVEILNLDDITSEPSEIFTITSTPSPAFFSTIYPTNTVNTINDSKTNFIIIIVFSSISGLLFIFFILWCKTNYNFHNKYNKNFEHENKNYLNYDIENFGTQFILDDV